MLAADSDGWRKMVKKRMKHLEKFERRKGNLRTGEEIERNIVRERENGETPDERMGGMW